MRARMALSISNQQCRLREVALRDKPAHMVDLSPKGTVPILHLPEGRVLEQSLDIALWALQRSDPERWLEPQLGSLSEMKALIEQNDGSFKDHLDRYKYSVRYEEGTDPIYHRDEGATFLNALNDHMNDQAQLFGDRPALADIAIFPFVRQFANTDRDWFDSQPLANLQTWLEGHLNSALFQNIMKKAPVWAPGVEDTLFPA